MGNKQSIGDYLWHCQCLTAHPKQTFKASGSCATRTTSVDASRPFLTSASESRVLHHPSIPTGSQNPPLSPSASDSGICLTPACEMPRLSTHKLETSPPHLVSPPYRLASPTSMDSRPRTPTEHDMKAKRSSSQKSSNNSIWFEFRKLFFRRTGNGSSSANSRSTPDSSRQQPDTTSGQLESKTEKRPPVPSSLPTAASEVPTVSSSPSADSIPGKSSAPVSCCLHTTTTQVGTPTLRVSDAGPNSWFPRGRAHPYARPNGFSHDLSPDQAHLSAGDFGDGKVSSTLLKTTATSPFPSGGDDQSSGLVSSSTVTVPTPVVGSDSPVVRHSPWHYKPKLRSSVAARDSVPLLSNGVPLAEAGAPITPVSTPTRDSLPGSGLKRDEMLTGDPVSSCPKDGGERPPASVGDYRLLRSLPGVVAHSRLRSYSTSCSLRSQRRAFRRDGRAATLVDDPMRIKRVTCSVVCETPDEDPFAPDNSAFVLSNDQQRQFLQTLNGMKLALFKLRRTLKENTGHRHAFQDQLDSRSSTLQRNRLSDGTLTLDLSSSFDSASYPLPELSATPSHLYGRLAEEMDHRLHLSHQAHTFDVATSLDIELPPFSAPPVQGNRFSFTAQASSGLPQSSGDFPPLPHTLEEALEEIVKLRTENAELKAKLAHSEDVPQK